MMQINLFGPTVVSAAGGQISSMGLGGSKPRQLLEMLALAAGRPVPKESLAERLWEGKPPRCYISTLESYVCVVRRRLSQASGEAAPLVTTTGGYLLDDQRVAVDITEVRHRIASGEPHEVATTLSVDVASLLADEPYAAWAVREREEFSTLASAAYLRAAREARLAGDFQLAITLARAASRDGCWSETATQELMRSLAEAGDGGQALVAYQELSTVMREELGVDPSKATQDLYLQILCADEVDQTATLSALLGRLRSMLEAGTPHTPREAPMMVEVGRLLLAQS